DARAPEASGCDRAYRLLQRRPNLIEQGCMMPVTITHAIEVSTEQQAAKLCAQYVRIVQRASEAEEEQSMYEDGVARAIYWQMESEAQLSELVEKLAGLIGKQVR